MIIALTMNPSLDISYPLNEFVIDSVNRIEKVSKTAGGKGLNVAKVIKTSRNDVIATGFLGGNIGNFIKSELEKDAIAHQFTPISQESRNCIAILHNGLQTEILESGPKITIEEQHIFKQNFTKLIEKSEVITMSGSLPKGIPDNYYSQLISIANQQQKKVLLDCSGSPLLNVLKSKNKPYLIKPNHEELSLLVGEKLFADDLAKMAYMLTTFPELASIPIVVVSLGKNGALAKIKDQIWHVVIPRINVINPVGSGDATLAGLAIGVLKNDPTNMLLKRAMVFGMLNAQEAITGMVNLANYDQLFTQIKTNVLSI